jgi:hypothetical protein
MKRYSDKERQAIREVAGREDTITYDSDMLVFRCLCREKKMFGLYLVCDPYWSRGQARYIKNEVPFLNDKQVELFCVRGEFFTLCDKVWLLEFLTSHVSQGPYEHQIRACIFDREGVCLFDNLHPELYRDIDYKKVM